VKKKKTGEKGKKKRVSKTGAIRKKGYCLRGESHSLERNRSKEVIRGGRGIPEFDMTKTFPIKKIKGERGNGRGLPSGNRTYLGGDKTPSWETVGRNRPPEIVKKGSEAKKGGGTKNSRGGLAREDQPGGTVRPRAQSMTKWTSAGKT